MSRHACDSVLWLNQKQKNSNWNSTINITHTRKKIYIEIYCIIFENQSRAKVFIWTHCEI